MESTEFKAFFYCLMKQLRRKRMLIFQQFLSSNQQIFQNSNIRRRYLKDILALESRLPEIFFKINVPRIRSIHRRKRRDNFMWSLQQEGNENFYYEYFRMGKDSFNLLCKKLSPYLPCPKVYVTAPLGIPKQVALCLYKLASCAEYRAVGDVFGVHKSTVHKYFHLVVKAILQLRKQYLYFPKLEEAKSIASAFQRVTNLPNIIGAIDGTHIPVLPPKQGYKEYINQMGWPSIIMQAVVDNKYLFRDVSVKLPGSNHKTNIFRESGLYKYSSRVIPTYNTDINGLQIPLMLSGNSTYPLLPWLMKPYTDCLNSEEESFNCHINSAQIIVENAFDRLKGRWRCLSKRMDIDPGFVPFVVLACSILHNFLEIEKESFLDSWCLDIQKEIEFPQPKDEIWEDIIAVENSDPKQMRDNLKNYLQNNFSLRKLDF